MRRHRLAGVQKYDEEPLSAAFEGGSLRGNGGRATTSYPNVYALRVGGFLEGKKKSLLYASITIVAQ